MEVVASLSQGRTAAAQCGLFTHKSVPVIFEPPCTTTPAFTVYMLSFSVVSIIHPKKVMLSYSRHSRHLLISLRRNENNQIL